MEEYMESDLSGNFRVKAIANIYSNSIPRDPYMSVKIFTASLEIIL